MCVCNSGFRLAGSLQRAFSSADPFPSEAGVGAKRPGCKMRALPIRGVGGATPEWAGEKPVLTKSISCDGAQLKLLSRLDRGCRKLRGIQVSVKFALQRLQLPVTSLTWAGVFVSKKLHFLTDPLSSKIGLMGEICRCLLSVTKDFEPLRGSFL